jgi:hypothetical protein
MICLLLVSQFLRQILQIKKRLFFQIDLPLPSMLVCKKITYLYVNYYKIHQKYIFNYQNYLVIKYIKKINFGNSEFKYTEFPKFRSQFYGILISV